MLWNIPHTPSTRSACPLSRAIGITAAILVALPATGQTRTEDFKLLASDAAASDVFGGSIAISGTTAIVGANGNDDAGPGSGSAYLFDTPTGLQLFKITAADAAAGDSFGTSVAISGTTAIVGARNDDDLGTNSGSAYLFDTTTGMQLLKLTPTDGAANDNFGNSVAISGTTAIIGSVFDDDAGTSSGSAYLFDTTTGQQLFKITAADASANTFFGIKVAISGTTAIVGSNGNNFTPGSAYLFDTTTGQQLFKITGSDTIAGDAFGNAIAIAGTTAIVGANQRNDAGTNSGAAYLFNTTTGQQLFKINATDAATNDFFGASVSISGTTAIIGASGNSDAGTFSGSAYLFSTTTGQQFFKLAASDAAASDSFGSSVAFTGATAFVGATGNTDAGSFTGSAYLFFIAPAVSQQPQSIIVTAGQTAVFSVAVADTSAMNYQWRRDGINLTDGGNITGAQSPTLQIVTTENDDAIYDCVLSNPAITTTQPAILAVRSSPNPCIVDLNGDGFLDNGDLILFVSLFLAGCP